MTRWEYRYVVGEGSWGNWVHALNKAGAEGWECFAREFHTESGYPLFWLKRPVEVQP